VGLSSFFGRCQLWVGSFLSRRSALRCNRPSDARWPTAVAYLIAGFPIAIVLAIPLLARRSVSPPLNVVVLDVPGEFAQFVQHMEALRVAPESINGKEVVLALSRWRHKSLGSLYSFQTGKRVVWGGRVSGLIQQALLLQPTFLARIQRDDPRLKRHPYLFPEHSLPISPRISAVRHRVLSDLDLAGREYVALATYSLEYDRERNPSTAVKQTVLGTIGDELVDAIDFLQEKGLGIVMLGSPETHESRIARKFPRLSDFSTLGGPHEIALASCCKYFWTDNAGAWWLGAPFKRPVLITNNATQRPRKGKMPSNHLIVPVRFQDEYGRDLTFREIYSKSNSFFYKSVSRNEFRIIRNSPEEIVEAQTEMLARLSNTWVDSDLGQHLQTRLREIQEDYPDMHPVRVSSSFLCRHPHLLT